MGARAVKLGALGAVISGNIRDTKELEELGLKVIFNKM
jgi:regulator of RNase E activity RraA